MPVTSAETNVPGFYNFDLIAAVRHEHYSGIGASTVPKFGFRWQPIPHQITFVAVMEIFHRAVTLRSWWSDQLSHLAGADR